MEQFTPMQNPPAVTASPFTTTDRNAYLGWLARQADPKATIEELISWILTAAGDQPRIAMELRAFQAVRDINAKFRGTQPPPAPIPLPPVFETKLRLALHAKTCKAWTNRPCDCMPCGTAGDLGKARLRDRSADDSI